MATPLQGTQSAQNAIQRVHYTHDAMIDLILGRPGVSQGEIAKYFGYQEAWVSRIICSDAFQARLAERRTELMDPLIAQTFEERIKGAAATSLEIVQTELDHMAKMPAGNPLRREFGMQALALTTKALGMGARPAPGSAPANVTNNFVVALPEKAPTAQGWVEEARQRATSTAKAGALDVSAKEVSNG